MCYLLTNTQRNAAVHSFVYTGCCCWSFLL